MWNLIDVLLCAVIPAIAGIQGWVILDACVEYRKYKGSFRGSGQAVWRCDTPSCLVGDRPWCSASNAWSIKSPYQPAIADSALSNISTSLLKPMMSNTFLKCAAG